MLSSSHSFWHFLMSLVFPCLAFLSYYCCLPSSYYFIASSCVWGSGVSGLSGSSFRSPPPYSVEQHIAKEGIRHDVLLFCALQDYPERLSILQNKHARDTAATACRKGWTHWGGWGASDYRTASSKLEITFVRCAEEVDYQRRIAASLVNWRREKVLSPFPMRPTCFLMKTSVNYGK